MTQWKIVAMGVFSHATTRGKQSLCNTAGMNLWLGDTVPGASRWQQQQQQYTNRFIQCPSRAWHTEVWLKGETWMLNLLSEHFFRIVGGYLPDWEARANACDGTEITWDMIEDSLLVIRWCFSQKKCLSMFLITSGWLKRDLRFRASDCCLTQTDRGDKSQLKSHTGANWEQR